MSAGVLLVLVTATPLNYWWATWLSGSWNEPFGDVLIVLAGSALEDGVLGESSYWRSVYAVRAFRGRAFRYVVITGGGAGQPARAMADFAVAGGVPRDALLLETASRSTRENALYLAPLIRDLPGRKVLLTSDYHMFRASRVFQMAGLEVVPAPFPDARKRTQNWRKRWGVFLELCEESAKVVYYGVRGWI